MWEYKEEFTTDEHDLIETLNSYGKENWEAFQLEKVVDNCNYRTYYKVFLKRRTEKILKLNDKSR